MRSGLAASVSWMQNMPKTTFKEHFSHVLAPKKLFLLLYFVLVWGFWGGWFVIGCWLVGFFISSLWTAKFYFNFLFIWISGITLTVRNSSRSSTPSVWPWWFPRIPGFHWDTTTARPSPPTEVRSRNSCDGFQSLLLTNEHPKMERAESFSQPLLLSQQISQTNMTAHSDNFTLSSRNAICRIWCILNYFNLCISKLLLLNELL